MVEQFTGKTSCSIVTSVKAVSSLTGVCLLYTSDHSGGQALDRQEGQGIQFIAHVEASGEGLSVAVDLGEYAHGAQGHQRHLDTTGQANADDLTEQFADGA